MYQIHCFSFPPFISEADYYTLTHYSGIRWKSPQRFRTQSKRYTHFSLATSLFVIIYRLQMEELEGDTPDLHVYHQPNEVEQLKSELGCKKMLLSKNSINISNVVGQGKQFSTYVRGSLYRLLEFISFFTAQKILRTFRSMELHQLNL